MATSITYWNFSEAVRSELEEVHGLAVDAYAYLEENDDVAELAEKLGEIKKRVDHISAQIEPALPLLKKTAAALEALPSYKRP